MPITLITRNAICDGLRERKTNWSGRLSHPEFLSRLYKLNELPSHDRRYSNAAADIMCHTVTWPGDWDNLWIFEDQRFELPWDDERLLAFLEEMLHPTIRPDTDEVLELVNFLNSHLTKDGWHLVEIERISDRPVFKASRTGHLNPIVPVVEALDSAYVQRQISRARENIDKDPELAIGSAKELIETTCKTMLARLEAQGEDELPRLVRRTLDRLGVDLSGSHDPTRAEKAVKRLLSSLSGLGAAVGEVRNTVGTGHGRDASVGDLQPMYARLVVNATATLVTFMMERFHVVREAGRSTSPDPRGSADTSSISSSSEPAPVQPPSIASPISGYGNLDLRSGSRMSNRADPCTDILRLRTR